MTDNLVFYRDKQASNSEICLIGRHLSGIFLQIYVALRQRTVGLERDCIFLSKSVKKCLVELY